MEQVLDVFPYFFLFFLKFFLLKNAVIYKIPRQQKAC